MKSSVKEISVQIYKNSQRGKCIKLSLRTQQTSFQGFLQACSEALKIKASRVFDKDGDEITMISQLILDNDYYISEGEKFNISNDQNRMQQSNLASEQQSNLIQYTMSILGAGAVGKSNVTLRYAKNQIFDNYDPTLQDDYTKQTKIDNKLYEIKITDTAGMEDYYSLRARWMKDRDGLIFLYAIDSQSSFQDILQFLELYSNLDKNPDKPTSIAIVGNKLDLVNDRKVSIEEGRKLAQKYNAIFFETSAKTSQNIEELFVSVLKIHYYLEIFNLKLIRIITSKQLELKQAKQLKQSQSKKKPKEDIFDKCTLI